MSCPDIPYRTALTLKNETSSPIHGGASSDPDHKDGTVKAARIAIECLRDGKTALGAVVKSIEMFENDPLLTLGQGLLFVKTGKPSKWMLPVCKALDNSEPLQQFPG
ncbi:MAG: hypothetical protein E3J76_01170 [Candidatus Aminicenantes bacterium]|nr:MAG: hypothetical protein E3J76_01170 [Candidatus Aminicenantes bacterium]